LRRHAASQEIHLIRTLLLAALAAAAPWAQAGPMGFKDSTMAMGDFGPNWRESWVNYAFTSRDAVGIGATWMRSDDKRLKREFAEVTYTRLLKRWNGEHSQANLWLLAGVGPVRGSDGGGAPSVAAAAVPDIHGHEPVPATASPGASIGFGRTRTMVSPGLSADWETTRLYVSATARLFRASGLNHDYGAVRAGFSFYEVDYEETQPWLIVEARRMRGLSHRTEITPMLRLIHNRYFIEAGVNTMKQPRFNFMYIF